MRALVKQALRGNKDAFVELIQQNTQDMYKVARSILTNEEDIADAIQETILTCYEKLKTLQQPKYFKTWLTRILINQCNDIVRREKREIPGDVFIYASDVDTQMGDSEFRQMLSGLDEKYRLIVVLYYVRGLRVKDIAELLEMNEGTVKTRLARGREKLKEMYDLGKTKEHGNTEHYVLSRGEMEVHYGR